MPSERCDAAKNRKRILAVAKELFAENRLEETSMQEIARAAGVGQGTLYRRFADKGELCEALFADDMAAFRELAETHLSATAASTPALSRLEWLLTKKIRFVDARLSLFLAAHEIAGSKRNDIFKKSHHTWTRVHVMQLLEEAQASGEAEPVDVAFAADAVLASFAPPLLAYQRQVLGYSLERVTQGVTQLFIKGLRRDPLAAETVHRDVAVGMG